MRDDFAVFILTHGRAKNVITYETLRRSGYTGKIYLIVDDEDKQVAEYKKKYKDQVVVFNKESAIQSTDSGDNFGKRNSVVYARNWSFVIAKELGLDYFLQLDDDYNGFRYSVDERGHYITSGTSVGKLDDLFSACLNFLIDSGFDSVALAQGGDFIGGPSSGLMKNYFKKKIPRKIMNSFFFATDKPVEFIGRINEDVNLYVSEGIRGKLFGTIAQIRLGQLDTQSNPGGLTDIYLDLGTYVKSFYSVMYAPSCVTIIEMGVTNRRLHHKINWKAAAPVILSEDVKKKAGF